MNRIALIAVSVIVPMVWIATGALMYTTMFMPGQDDFVAARGTVKSLETNGGSTGEAFQVYLSAISEASKSGKTYQQIVDGTADKRQAFEDELTERRQLNTTLAKSKARYDKPSETAYQAYVKKELAYLYYIEGYAEAYPSFSSSFNSCADIYQVSRQARSNAELSSLHKAAATDCLEDLDRLSKTSFKPTAAYAKEFTRIVKGRQAAFDGIATNSISLDAAGTTIKQLAADSKINDPVSAIGDAKEAARPAGELDALDKALEARASKS